MRLIALMISFTMYNTLACTGVVVGTKNGKIMPARTMEFGFDVQSNIAVVPRGTKIATLSQVRNRKGFTFKAKYGFAGANTLGKNIVVDGVNEAGLYFGAFYFAGYAKYEKLTNQNKSKAVSSEELGNWVLGNFKNINELKKGLKTISVVGSYIKEINGFAPFHYAISDKEGNSVVLEFTEKGLTVHENTVNVVTNNPTYDWHLTNLDNYVNLNPNNKKSFKIGKRTIKPTGEGSGFIGMPGDFTSTSRFVRATAYVNTMNKPKDINEAVFKTFHLLNAFDIPLGAIRAKHGDETLTDYTVWTSAADLYNPTYYYKTYNTQRVEKVNLAKALQNTTKPRIIKMETGFKVIDRSNN